MKTSDDDDDDNAPDDSLVPANERITHGEKHQEPVREDNLDSQEDVGEIINNEKSLEENKETEGNDAICHGQNSKDEVDTSENNVNEDLVLCPIEINTTNNDDVKTPDDSLVPDKEGIDQEDHKEKQHVIEDNDDGQEDIDENINNEKSLEECKEIAENDAIQHGQSLKNEVDLSVYCVHSPGKVICGDRRGCC
jgi:hypothetical protein